MMGTENLSLILLHCQPLPEYPDQQSVDDAVDGET
jgi:hypothetical protein